MTSRFLALTAAIATSALPAHAQAVFAEPMAADPIGPYGFAVYRAFCDGGDLISGGYRITSWTEPSDYMIVGSYPDTATQWAVSVRNLLDRPLELGGVVYAVCTEN
jgi:hypothetical protein